MAGYPHGMLWAKLFWDKADVFRLLIAFSGCFVGVFCSWNQLWENAVDQEHAIRILSSETTYMSQGKKRFQKSKDLLSSARNICNHNETQVSSGLNESKQDQIRSNKPCNATQQSKSRRRLDRIQARHLRAWNPHLAEEWRRGVVRCHS